MAQMLTTKKAADFLGVSTKSIKNWRKTGKLIPVETRENGYSLYSLEQLGNFKNELGKLGNKVCKVGNFPTLQTREDKTGETQTRETIFAPLEKNCTPNFAPVTVKGFVQGENVTDSTNDIVKTVTQNDENVIGFKYKPPETGETQTREDVFQTGETRDTTGDIDTQTGETKKATDNAADKQKNFLNTNYNSENGNFNEKKDVKGLLKNLPTAIQSLKRYLNVRTSGEGAGKTPQGKEWQKPENQKLLADIVTAHAAFFLKGVPNVLAFDWDNVLNDEGKFTNATAQNEYKNFRAVFPKAYCEKSAGGHGLHILFFITDGLFKNINAALEFDKAQNSKVELFYNFNKTITLTGNLFDCTPNSEIPTGDIADEFVAEILKKIELQNKSQNKNSKSYFSKDFFTSDEYEKAKALAALDCIDFSQLDYISWFSVMTSCKNLGIDYSIVDAKNAQDTGLTKDGKPRYNPENNLATWKSINDTSIGMANLCAKAKQFGFDFKKFFNDWRKTHSDESRDKRKKKSYFDADMEDKANRPATTKAVIDSCPIDLILPFPSSYHFTPEGITRYVSSLERYVLCCHTPVVITARFILQPSNAVQYKVAFFNHNGKWQFVTVDGSFIADSRKIIQLADSGVGITSTDAKYLSAFLMELINFGDNKTIISDTDKYSKIGWIDDKTFISPYVTKDADYIVERNNYNYSKIFGVKGNCEKWIEKFVANFCDSIVRFIFGVVLLAPLVKPFNLMNVWLHIHGTSSSGKTAMLKFPLSIYGNPDTKDGLGRTLDASKTYFMSVVESLNCFPVLFDELESLQSKSKNEILQSLIYNYTGGTGGQRSKRNGEERETKTFAGVVLTTGEQPISADNSKRGALKRTVELRVPPLFVSEQAARNTHIFSENNYGHFGSKWIQYITSNIDTLKTEFNSLLDSMFNTSDTDNEELKAFKQKLNNYDATNLKVVFAACLAFKHFMQGVLFKENYQVIESLKGMYKDSDNFITYDAKKILALLPTLSQLDETERAFNALTDFVNAHPKNFIAETDDRKENIADGFATFGKIYLNGDVAFYQTELTRILEKELNFSSCKKLLTEWNDSGKLKTAKDRIRTTVRINRQATPVIYIKGLCAKVQDDTDEE